MEIMGEKKEKKTIIVSLFYLSVSFKVNKTKMQCVTLQE